MTLWPGGCPRFPHLWKVRFGACWWRLRIGPVAIHGVETEGPDQCFLLPDSISEVGGLCSGLCRPSWCTFDHREPTSEAPDDTGNPACNLRKGTGRPASKRICGCTALVCATEEFLNVRSDRKSEGCAGEAGRDYGQQQIDRIGKVHEISGQVCEYNPGFDCRQLLRGIESRPEYSESQFESPSALANASCLLCKV